MKILVVEDTEDSRILIEAIFIAEGYEVVAAVNGIDALEKIKASPPDIIVSDILMPKMDGFDLCRHLKLDPRYKLIPFVFYTATYIDERDEKFAMSLGATRFIIKPEDPVKLVQAIKEVVTEYQNGNYDCVPLRDIEDQQFESQYSEVLSRKLDKKIHEIEDRKELLKFITDAVPALIAEIDKFGCYQYANKAYEKWFALSANEIVGKKIKEVVGEVVSEISQPYIDKALAGEEVVYEGYIEDIEGSKRYILARYIPHFNENNETYSCFLFINDLTEQKQAEEEKQKLLFQLRHSQKMDAIGHLVGGIAHDFNNILSIILGYTELPALTGYDNKDGKFEEYINQIRTAGLRGRDLISQIMKSGRKSNEQAEFSVDTKPLVKEVIRLVEQTFPATIIIDAELDEFISPVVVELTQLHQVIVNLLINSRDAIVGHGRITIKLEQQQIKSVVCNSCKETFEGNFVVLTITDNGAGIEQKQLERIFELFYTTKEVGKGTGIGLAMVHDIVHESRGHILIESVVGQGTTFKIFFPVSGLLEKTVEENENESLSSERDDIKLSLMLVDDEASLVEYLNTLLTSNGYRVTRFTNSLDALAAFQDAPDDYDLVLTDQVMPHMTGAEMAEKMLRLRANLPVILCSGNHSLSDEFIKMLGVKVILQKPVPAKQLLAEIKSILVD